MFASIRTLLSRLRALFAGQRLDQEFDDEVGSHLALLIEENIRRGMTPEEARCAALRSFGGIAQARESNREHRGVHHVETLLQDLRYALRTVHKSPGFAAVVILTLALGIGANTAIFQLLNALRIRTLPVKDPQELVEIKIADTHGRRGSVNRFGEMTNLLWERLRASSDAFSGMLAWGETGFNIGNGVEGRYVKALMVSGDFFNVLGVRPQLGRLLSPDDDRRGCGASVAVISYSFWQREFAGRADVIGSKLSLDFHPVEIVGVTPASFYGMEIGETYDVAAPLCSEPALKGEASRLDNGAMWWLVVNARLKAGSSLERVNAQLRAISPAIFKASVPANYPGEGVKTYLAFQLTASPAAGGVSQLRNDYCDLLFLLLGGAGLVLLIACANLANLMLARSRARDREIAVRLALGASRARLLRQLMTESMVLALLGAIAGFALAKLLTGFLVAMLKVNGDPVFLDLHSDWRVLGFTAGLALLTCLFFGITPALRATATDPGVALKSGSRTTSGRERFGLRRGLVVTQVSLSLVLMAGALLFSRSLRNLMTVDAGFRETGILVAGIDYSRLRLPAERRLAFQQELIERLQAIPGMESVATTDIIPVSGDSWSNNVWMDSDAAGDDPSHQPEILFNRVSSDFFRTMQIAFLAGRTFDSRDRIGEAQVAVVNEAFARQLTNGANPVGRRFWRQRTPREPQTLYEIVGLVKNTKYRNLREDFRPIAFLASTQDPQPGLEEDFLMRSGLPPASLTSAVKAAITSVSPEMVVDFDTLPAMIENSLLPERLMVLLSSFFGLLAGILAAVGLYGLVSYMVARRTNEIGIRMALGADRGRVMGLIMSETFLLLIVGLVLGVGFALLGAGAAGSLLFGITARDPLTLAMAAALLALAALLAGYWPARRASRLDPVEALREE